MAQQIGILKITGTIGGICFYRMQGVYYARVKSSLTRKRVRSDRAFAKTMQYADLLGRAAKIASERYKRTVPKAERSRRKYQELVGVVMRELREEATKGQRKIQQQNHEQHEWARKNVGLLATDEDIWTQIMDHEKHELTRRCFEELATDVRKYTQIKYSAALVKKPRINTKVFLPHMSTDERIWTPMEYHEKHEWTRKDVELLATDECKWTQMQYHEEHEWTRRCGSHRFTRMDADELQLY